VSNKGNDFLAVIDADPESTSYGHLIATAVTDQVSMQVHHTEYVMPQGGLLFANDHLAGRTFVFDVRNPLQPKVSTSFTDMAGYAHPHSFLRLPNGHVLASFQHMRHGAGDMRLSNSGGLVEIDDQGHVIRAASSADPAFPDTLLMPYRAWCRFRKSTVSSSPTRLCMTRTRAVIRSRCGGCRISNC
jgi:hypothetical protein